MGASGFQRLGRSRLCSGLGIREAEERVDTGSAYVFVDSDVLLGVGFKPYYVSCGSAHNHVDVAGCFGERVDIVTQHVCFCE